MKIKFAISSNINFYKTTHPIIVESLLAAGVPNNDIYFFVGGYHEYVKVDDKVNFYFVNHNSIDFTALVSVLELNLTSDYWFLLHDTCFVGTNFYNAILSYEHTTDVVKLRPILSMNIGSYKQSYLESIKTKLISEFKNCDYSEKVIDFFKRKCIRREDYFFDHSDVNIYSDMGERIQEPTDYYNTGVFRIVEYYHRLDLYKTKANWDQKSTYEIKL
jgi:hypothetical protein